MYAGLAPSLPQTTLPNSVTVQMLPQADEKAPLLQNAKSVSNSAKSCLRGTAMCAAAVGVVAIPVAWAFFVLSATGHIGGNTP